MQLLDRQLDRQLSVLVDRLDVILASPTFIKAEQGTFIYDDIFEDMLGLALDIDMVTAHTMFRAIYKDVNATMAMPLLESIISNHIQKYLSNKKDNQIFKISAHSLSDRQLTILANRLMSILYSPSFVEAEEGNFISDEIFEGMLELVLDIDVLSTNLMLRAIYKDANSKMKIPALITIINDHIQQYLLSKEQPIA